MNNYFNILNYKYYRLFEKVIEVPFHSSIDITDIFYKYQKLFERIEILRALNISVKLLLQDKNIKLNSNQKEAALFYLSIINNKEYQLDWYLFCELPRTKIINYEPWSVMVTFKIYRDRIVEPLILLYPDLNEYLMETKKCLNQVIDEIERRITIIIPGKIKIAKDEEYIFDKNLILGRK